MTKEEILQKLLFDTRLRGLSKNTQDEYYTKVKLFQNYFDKPATELQVEDIQKFLYYLLTEKGHSSGTVNTFNSGLRFLYNVTLDIPINLNKIPCHKKQHKLPDILTRAEITSLFNACDNLRDKCMLMTMYNKPPTLCRSYDNEPYRICTQVMVNYQQSAYQILHCLLFEFHLLHYVDSYVFD